jgi:hypothetical protein
MRTRVFAALATSLLVGLAVSSVPASAKTVKECQKEWRADKVAMQAAHKTEKVYVAECHPPAVKPAAKPAAATPAATPKDSGGGKY